MSPSPVPSYALTPIAPMSEGGGGSPFMSLGSPTPSASGKGWRRPEQYAGALRIDAAWLNKFRSGGFGELSEADKLHVVDGVGCLIQAALDAGVLKWLSRAMESVMGQILTSTGEDEENHSTHFDQDVDLGVRANSGRYESLYFIIYNQIMLNTCQYLVMIMYFTIQSQYYNPYYQPRSVRHS
jgi:hypothetical protein